MFGPFRLFVSPPHMLCFGFRWCSDNQWVRPCRFTWSSVCWVALHPCSCPLRRWVGVCRSPVLIRRQDNRQPLPTKQIIQHTPLTRGRTSGKNYIVSTTSCCRCHSCLRVESCMWLWVNNMQTRGGQSHYEHRVIEGWVHWGSHV